MTPSRATCRRSSAIAPSRRSATPPARGRARRLAASPRSTASKASGFDYGVPAGLAQGDAEADGVGQPRRDLPARADAPGVPRARRPASSCWPARASSAACSSRPAWRWRQSTTSPTPTRCTPTSARSTAGTTRPGASTTRTRSTRPRCCRCATSTVPSTLTDEILDRGARVVLLPTGPAYGRSPGDPYFDPVWSRLNEAGVTVAFHIMPFWYFDAISPAWGHDPGPRVVAHVGVAVDTTSTASGRSRTRSRPLIFDNLFGRHPNLMALVAEHGAELGAALRSATWTRAAAWAATARGSAASSPSARARSSSATSGWRRTPRTTSRGSSRTSARRLDRHGLGLPPRRGLGGAGRTSSKLARSARRGDEAADHARQRPPSFAMRCSPGATDVDLVPRRGGRRRVATLTLNNPDAAQRLEPGHGGALLRAPRRGRCRPRGAGHRGHRRRHVVLPGPRHPAPLGGRRQRRRCDLRAPAPADLPARHPQAHGRRDQRRLRRHRAHAGARLRRPLRRPRRPLLDRLRPPGPARRVRQLVAPAPAHRRREGPRPAAVGPGVRRRRSQGAGVGVPRVRARDRAGEAQAYAGDLAANCSPRSMAAIRRQVYGDLSRRFDESMVHTLAPMQDFAGEPRLRRGRRELRREAPGPFAPLAADFQLQPTPATGHRRWTHALSGRRALPQAGACVPGGRPARGWAGIGAIDDRAEADRLRRGVAGDARRPRLPRRSRGPGLRRRRADQARAGGAGGGAGPRRCPGDGRQRQLQHQDAGRHASAMGHRGPEAPLPAADPVRRGRLVPGLLGARRRVRPGRVVDAGRPRRRPLDRHRPEDLDVAGPRGELDLPPCPHRSGGLAAPGHHLPARAARPTRHRDPPDHHAVRRDRVQRGVLRRRHAHRPTMSSAR